MQDILQLLDFALKLQRPRTRSKGRPVKRNWMESVENGVTGAKLALPAGAVYCLWKRGEITFEQAAAVIAHVAERIKTAQVVECFPSSPKWIVREALRAMGHAKAETLSVAFDDIVAEGIGDGYLLWERVQQQKSQSVNEGLLRTAPKIARQPVRTAAGDRATSYPDDPSTAVGGVTGTL